MFDHLFDQGYQRFRNVISNLEMPLALKALFDFNSVTNVTDEFKYGQAPAYCKSGALDKTSMEMGMFTEGIFGKGNVKGRPLQLIGNLDGNPPVASQKIRHVDNVSNSFKAADKAFDTAESDAKKRGEIYSGSKSDFLEYPRFNAIVCLAITESWVRVWPESHRAVAAYYSQVGSRYDLVSTINEKLIETYPGDGIVVKLEEGDLLIMNHLLMHAATDHEPLKNPRYSIPGKGGLSARLYQRFETVNPSPVGWNAMRTPWFGCHGVMEGR